MDTLSAKPKFKTQRLNVRQTIWDAFRDLGNRTSEVIKNSRQSAGLYFFASTQPPTVQIFEISLTHGLDREKNSKHIPSASPLVEGVAEIQAVHWEVTSQGHGNQVLSVVHSTTARKLGEMTGMGKGTRLTAVFESEEEKHIWTPGDLISSFRSSIRLVAPPKIRDRLIKAQVIELGVHND